MVPDEYMGDIIGDMNKRRGRIMGMDQVDGLQCVTAEVPQGEMFKYATDLRSMTQARGSFTMRFERYEEVPAGRCEEDHREHQARGRGRRIRSQCGFHTASRTQPGGSAASTFSAPLPPGGSPAVPVPLAAAQGKKC